MNCFWRLSLIQFLQYQCFMHVYTYNFPQLHVNNVCVEHNDSNYLLYHAFLCTRIYVVKFHDCFMLHVNIIFTSLYCSHCLLHVYCPHYCCARPVVLDQLLYQCVVAIVFTCYSCTVYYIKDITLPAAASV